MAEVDWVKLATRMFDDEKIKVIDTMPERDLIQIIWVKLIIQAGKCNAGGYVFLSEGTPYNDETLAAIFNRPLNSIRLAIGTLTQFGMIRIDETTGYLLLPNFSKYQNIEGLDRIRAQTRERVKAFRERHSQNTLPQARNVTVTLSNATEQDKKKNTEEEIEREQDSSSSSALNIFSLYEQNIGGQLGGLLIDKLKEAETLYPMEWIRDAMLLAVSRQKRRWDYVEGILKNWDTNGRDDKPKTQKVVYRDLTEGFTDE